MVVSKVLKHLTKTELNYFEKFLEQRNKRNDVRNVDLLNAFLHGKELTIKEEIGANAFNVLKKRFKDSLFDFVGNQIFKQENSSQTKHLKQLAIARKLFDLDEEKEAFKILNKIENETKEIEAFTTLNDIYHTKIEYAYLLTVEEQDKLFENFKINHVNIHNQEKVNLAFARIKSECLNTDKKGLSLDLNTLITNALNDLNLDSDTAYNYKVLYQIAQILDLQGANNRNYEDLDLFFEEYLDKLEENPVNNFRYESYRVEVYYILANIYFRKGDFDTAKIYLERINYFLENKTTPKYKERLVKFTTLNALIHNFEGNWQQSLIEIEELKFKTKLPKIQLLNPMLIQAMIYMQQGDFKLCKSILADLNRTDAFYEKLVGVKWVLNKNILEILLHIDVQDYVSAEAKIVSVNRKYGDYLKHKDQLQVLPFLKIIKNYISNPSQVTSENFKSKVDNIFSWKEHKKQDVFLMCFYAWLKAKMTNENIYKVTFDLLTQ